MDVNSKRGSLVSAVLATGMSIRTLFLLFLTLLASVLVCTEALAQNERLRSERIDNSQLVNAPKSGADWNVLVLLNVSYAKSQGVMVAKALDSVIKVPH
jgi:hypothetical protein